MTSESKQRLLDLFRERALSFGHFVLASGKESSYYINSKKALFHSETAALLAEALFDKIKDLDINAVGGLEVGAIPLTATIVMQAHQQGKELEGFFVRKQVKDHGSKERIEGRFEQGWKVAIVDDVLTTGGSAQQAVEVVEAAGGIVEAVVCIVDRLQGAEKLFGSKYRYLPLFTIHDFGIDPK